MKVSVLIPSQEYKSYAGARIRYGRLHSGLLVNGIDLQLEDIDKFSPLEADCDVLIISKCHDARSLIAADTLSARGRLVGVDLFDDYFSQVADSRLTRYRYWLSKLLETCHFVLCSTPALAQVVRTYRRDVPLHVVNDPAERVEADQLKRLLAAKLAEAREGGSLRLAWFGVGDNPHFDVGLSNLAASSAFLQALSRGGMDVEITILTNERALESDNLARMGRLPVRSTVDVWTEEREREVLAEAMACFLPVGFQPFSIAKSLNRAVTALSSGCQVLSSGYPLYEPIASLVYRDAASFLDDLEQGSMRLSAEGLERYEKAMRDFADAEVEASSLARFMHRLERSAEVYGRQIALIHGTTASEPAHAFVQSVGGLSVASPYCSGKLRFDVVFQGRSPASMDMLISERVLHRVTPEVRRQLRPAENIANRKFWHAEASFAAVAEGTLSKVSLPFQLATFDWAMRQISEQLEATFGQCRAIVSENSPYPFDRAA